MYARDVRDRIGTGSGDALRPFSRTQQPQAKAQLAMRIAQNWRIRKQRYGLVGEVCDRCGGKIFPPREVCPYCAELDQTPFQFSGNGKGYSPSPNGNRRLSVSSTPPVNLNKVG